MNISGKYSFNKCLMCQDIVLGIKSKINSFLISRPKLPAAFQIHPQVQIQDHPPYPYSTGIYSKLAPLYSLNISCQLLFPLKKSKLYIYSMNVMRKHTKRPCSLLFCQLNNTIRATLSVYM